ESAFGPVVRVHEKTDLEEPIQIDGGAVRVERAVGGPGRWRGKARDERERNADFDEAVKHRRIPQCIRLYQCPRTSNDDQFPAAGAQKASLFYSCKFWRVFRSVAALPKNRHPAGCPLTIPT